MKNYMQTRLTFQWYYEPIINIPTLPIPNTNYADKSLFHKFDDGTWELDKWSLNYAKKGTIF